MDDLSIAAIIIVAILIVHTIASHIIEVNQVKMQLIESYDYYINFNRIDNFPARISCLDRTRNHRRSPP